MIRFDVILADVVNLIEFDGASYETIDATDTGFKSACSGLIAEFLGITYSHFITKQALTLTASSDLANLPSLIFDPVRVVVAGKVIRPSGIHEPTIADITTTDGRPTRYWKVSGDRIQFDRPLSTEVIAEGVDFVDGFAHPAAVSNDADLVPIGINDKRALTYYCAFHLGLPVVSDPTSASRLNSYIEEAEAKMRKISSQNKERYFQ
jgi:hypothetical protein